MNLMTHLVAHYPSKQTAFQVAKAMLEAGSEIIEVQFPFSDPSADGPVIENACTKALAAGFTVDQGFELVSEIRNITQKNIFIMSYAGLVYARGVKSFLQTAKDSGATGVIIPDFMPGYDENTYKTGKEIGISVIPVIAPTITEDRLKLILDEKPDFIYASIRRGITGKETHFGDEQINFLKMLQNTGKKILAGFGVRTAEAVRLISPYVYAVIVGSVLVSIIEELGAEAAPKGIENKVKELLGSK